jgi:hypothetical protein
MDARFVAALQAYMRERRCQLLEPHFDDVVRLPVGTQSQRATTEEIGSRIDKARFNSVPQTARPQRMPPQCPKRPRARHGSFPN